MRPAGKDSRVMAPTVPTTSMKSTRKSLQEVLVQQQDHLGSGAFPVSIQTVFFFFFSSFFSP